MPKGMPKDRLRAVTTCRERQWGPGLVLQSKEWTIQLEIVEVGARFVFVKRGTQRDRVFSFPPDVSVVEP